jgi:hypothetical protein
MATALKSCCPDNGPSCCAGLATCAFWGYCVGSGAVTLGHALLEASRLPIVFDLDETLLVAYSLHTLDVRLAKLRDSGYQISPMFHPVLLCCLILLACCFGRRVPSGCDHGSSACIVTACMSHDGVPTAHVALHPTGGTGVQLPPRRLQGWRTTVTCCTSLPPQTASRSPLPTAAWRPSSPGLPAFHRLLQDFYPSRLHRTCPHAHVHTSAGRHAHPAKQPAKQPGSGGRSRGCVNMQPCVSCHQTTVASAARMSRVPKLTVALSKLMLAARPSLHGQVDDRYRALL